MKKIYILLFAFVAVIISSCDDESYNLECGNVPGKHGIAVSKNEFWASRYNTADELFVDSSDGVTVDFTDLGTWYSVYKNEYDGYENRFVVDVSYNEFSIPRVAIFNCVGSCDDWRFVVPMTLSQEGGEPEIKFLTTAGGYASRVRNDWVAEGGTLTFTLFSNVEEMEIDCSEPTVQADYVYTPGTTSQGLKVTVPANPGNKQRTIYVNLSSGSCTATLTIDQAPATATVKYYHITLPRTGGTSSMTVESTNPQWIAECEQSWCTATKKDNQLVISATPNLSNYTRKAYVYIKLGVNSLATVTVTQDACRIVAEVASETFPYSGGSIMGEVSSDVDWKVVDKPAWLTVSPDNAKAGECSVTIKAEANNTSAQRSGELVLGQEGWAGNFIIKFMQNPFLPELDTETIAMPREGGTKTITVSSPGKWTASCPCDWLTITPVTGTGSGKVSITATGNPGDERRVGKITFDFEGKKQEVTVTQYGVDFEFTHSPLFDLDVYGGETQVYISTNVGYNVTVADNPDYPGGSSWLTAKAQDEKMFVVSAGYNASANPRGAYLIVSPNVEGYDSHTICMPVTQKGRTLEISALAVNLFGTAGSSEEYTVMSNGAAQIKWQSPVPSWAKLNVKTIKEGTSANDGLYSFSVEVEANDSETTRSANVEISLLGLPAGETKTIVVPVTQYGKGVYFFIDGFGPDKNWDFDNGSSNATINLNANWGNDNNWNF